MGSAFSMRKPSVPLVKMHQSGKGGENRQHAPPLPRVVFKDFMETVIRAIEPNIGALCQQLAQQGPGWSQDRLVQSTQYGLMVANYPLEGVYMPEIDDIEKQLDNLTQRGMGKAATVAKNQMAPEILVQYAIQMYLAQVLKECPALQTGDLVVKVYRLRTLIGGMEICVYYNPN